MSLRLRIRPAERRDMGALTAALAPQVDAAQLRQRFEQCRDGYRKILVAELDGRPVGTVSMGGHGFQRPDSLRLFALDVGEAFRGRGVGTALVYAVEAAAADRTLNEVNLEVALENEDAVRLYERLGYQRLGEQVMDRWEQHLDDGGSRLVEEPSWVMIKSLG